MSEMFVYMYVCMYQELLKKPQQIPRVFAHTWRIKLILILILILIHDINYIVVLSYGLHIMCIFFICSVEPH